VKEKPEIKRYRRMTAWDYTRGATLFVTIVTSPRRALFGRIEGGEMALSPLGEIVAQALVDLPRLNPGLTIRKSVVMPDHIHFNIHITAGLNEPLKVFGKAITRFKNYTTKQAKLMGLVRSEPSSHLCTEIAPTGQAAPLAPPGRGDGRAALGLLWQQGCHDHLCLCREFIDATERYIAYNAQKWWLMYSAPDALRVTEPLLAPCLDPADYWKGVGNTALLGEKLVALRVSRQVRSPAQIAAVVKRLENAVAKGYVILSGFVSPGEKAVREMLCANGNARFIRILPSSLPNRRFRPESRYVAPFAENRYLEIAKGNEEVEFDRAACLDYNAEIVEMALASGGVALYWRADGPHFTKEAA